MFRKEELENIKSKKDLHSIIVESEGFVCKIFEKYNIDIDYNMFFEDNTVSFDILSYCYNFFAERIHLLNNNSIENIYSCIKLVSLDLPEEEMFFVKVLENKFNENNLSLKEPNNLKFITNENIEVENQTLKFYEEENEEVEEEIIIKYNEEDVEFDSFIKMNNMLLSLDYDHLSLDYGDKAIKAYNDIIIDKKPMLRPDFYDTKKFTVEMEKFYSKFFYDNDNNDDNSDFVKFLNDEHKEYLLKILFSKVDQDSKILILDDIPLSLISDKQKLDLTDDDNFINLAAEKMDAYISYLDVKEIHKLTNKFIIEKIGNYVLNEKNIDKNEFFKDTSSYEYFFIDPNLFDDKIINYEDIKENDLKELFEKNIKYIDQRIIEFNQLDVQKKIKSIFKDVYKVIIKKYFLQTIYIDALDKQNKIVFSEKIIENEVLLNSLKEKLKSFGLITCFNDDIIEKMNPYFVLENNIFSKGIVESFSAKESFRKLLNLKNLYVKTIKNTVFFEVKDLNSIESKSNIKNNIFVNIIKNFTLKEVLNENWINYIHITNINLNKYHTKSWLFKGDDSDISTLLEKISDNGLSVDNKAISYIEELIKQDDIKSQEKGRKSTLTDKYIKNVLNEALLMRVNVETEKVSVDNPLVKSIEVEKDILRNLGDGIFNDKPLHKNKDGLALTFDIAIKETHMFQFLNLINNQWDFIEQKIKTNNDIKVVFEKSFISLIDIYETIPSFVKNNIRNKMILWEFMLNINPYVEISFVDFDKSKKITDLMIDLESCWKGLNDTDLNFDGLMSIHKKFFEFKKECNKKINNLFKKENEIQYEKIVNMLFNTYVDNDYSVLISNFIDKENISNTLTYLKNIYSDEQLFMIIEASNIFYSLYFDEKNENVKILKMDFYKKVLKTDKVFGKDLKELIEQEGVFYNFFSDLGNKFKNFKNINEIFNETNIDLKNYLNDEKTRLSFQEKVFLKNEILEGEYNDIDILVEGINKYIDIDKNELKVLLLNNKEEMLKNEFKLIKKIITLDEKTKLLDKFKDDINFVEKLLRDIIALTENFQINKYEILDIDGMISTGMLTENIKLNFNEDFYNQFKMIMSKHFTVDNIKNNYFITMNINNSINHLKKDDREIFEWSNDNYFSIQEFISEKFKNGDYATLMTLDMISNQISEQNKNMFGHIASKEMIEDMLIRKNVFKHWGNCIITKQFAEKISLDKLFNKVNELYEKNSEMKEKTLNQLCSRLVSFNKKYILVLDDSLIFNNRVLKEEVFKLLKEDIENLDPEVVLFIKKNFNNGESDEPDLSLEENIINYYSKNECLFENLLLLKNFFDSKNYNEASDIWMSKIIDSSFFKEELLEYLTKNKALRQKDDFGIGYNKKIKIPNKLRYKLFEENYNIFENKFIEIVNENEEDEFKLWNILSKNNLINTDTLSGGDDLVWLNEKIIENEKEENPNKYILTLLMLNKLYGQLLISEKIKSLSLKYDILNVELIDVNSLENITNIGMLNVNIERVLEITSQYKSYNVYNSIIKNLIGTVTKNSIQIPDVKTNIFNQINNIDAPDGFKNELKEFIDDILSNYLIKLHNNINISMYENIAEIPIDSISAYNKIIPNLLETNLLETIVDKRVKSNNYNYLNLDGILYEKIIIKAVTEEKYEEVKDVIDFVEYFSDSRNGYSNLFNNLTLLIFKNYKENSSMRSLAENLKDLNLYEDILAAKRAGDLRNKLQNQKSVRISKKL